MIIERNMLGQRLKQWRKERKITLVELSELIGTANGALSAIETGKTKPSAETLASLAKNTDIDIKWLLIGYEEDSSNMLKADEYQLLDLYRSASLEIKAAAINVLSYQKNIRNGKMSIVGNKNIQGNNNKIS